ncbi:MAG: hypothetical protein D6782_11925 [Alphaproteobacteria bacterium]|nr:MAG: hypothetical protein D6782_11925 [Alphaproteobacteria bacterium]
MTTVWRKKTAKRPLRTLLAILAGGFWLCAFGAAAEQATPGQSEFLYFKDERPAAQARPGAAAPAATDLGTFTSPSAQGAQRFFRLDSKAAALDVPMVGVFTARGARGQVGFVLDSKGVSWQGAGAPLAGDGMTIGLYSRIDLEAGAPPGFVAGARDGVPFEDRSLAMGMQVGYGGFLLEAGFARESGFLAGRARGFDLGFSYQERSWRASLQFSGRTQTAQERAFIDLRDQFGRSYAIELGASYDVWPGLSVAGGVRHSGYSDRFRLNVGDPISDSLIFMGTAFSF